MNSKPEIKFPNFGLFISLTISFVLVIIAILTSNAIIRSAAGIIAFVILLTYIIWAGLRYRRQITEYKKILATVQNLPDEDLRTALSTYVQSSSDSRLKTSEIISDNQQGSLKFAEEMKDSVYMITSINGSVHNINEKLKIQNDSILNSSAAIEEISQTISEFSDQIETQSSSVVQTSAAVEQMDASINNVRDITERKRESSILLQKQTETSQAQMQDMNALIEQVNNSVDSIQEIISVINNIASQTNLLSMNAAIEAAHAGDAGKGFAVVAEEIRKLAESTSTNSSLISNTLKAVIDDVGSVKSAGHEALNSYNLISSETKGIVGAFEEIINATSELNVGSHEIVSATQALNDITLQIKDGSREITESSREIRDSINMIVSVSNESTDEIKKISAIAQDINMIFLSISKSVINYENNLGEIDNFQNSESLNSGTGFPAVILILQHLLWVLRARAVIDGKLDIESESLTDHHNCSLGKWIENEAQPDIKNGSNFRQMEVEHENLHKIVNNIVQSLGQTSIEELEEQYSSLLISSDNVISSLLHINEAIKQ